MAIWVATGVSGSGRRELLDALAEEARSAGQRVAAHDVGELLRRECRRIGLPFDDQRILNVDRRLLESLRSSALRQAQLQIVQSPSDTLHFVGVHAVFRWKHRIIPGISYGDLAELNPAGLLNIVDDLATVCSTNRSNPKWTPDSLPSYTETQDWMMEEELVTETLGDVLGKPVFLVSRRHRIPNLLDLFFTPKKRIYLSYPITAIRKDNPKLLNEIQGPILKKLEELFVVFDPLAIKDMALVSRAESLTRDARQMVKARTIDRDFQFIEQADGIVVFYMTDKLSPGVIAEIQYAHRHQKPVFVAIPGDRSPFLEDVATRIAPTLDALMPTLRRWARDGDAT